VSANSKDWFSANLLLASILDPAVMDPLSGHTYCYPYDCALQHPTTEPKSDDEHHREPPAPRNTKFRTEADKGEAAQSFLSRTWRPGIEDDEGAEPGDPRSNLALLSIETRALPSYRPMDRCSKVVLHNLGVCCGVMRCGWSQTCALGKVPGYLGTWIVSPPGRRVNQYRIDEI
jgi:hypothetical protein